MVLFVYKYIAMQDSHLNQANVFSGSMNFDADDTQIKQEDYKYALNIRNGFGGIQGIAINVKGNGLVQYTLPVGNNICIGTCEDRRGQTVIYFVYNSNGNHQILQFFPQKITVGNPYGTIELIAIGGVLNFSPDWLITHAEMVNGELLYWTDAYTNEQEIVGNPPRKINIKKGNIVGKLLEYEVYAGLPNQGQFVNAVINAQTVEIDILDRATNNFVSLLLIPAITLATFANDPEGWLEYLATTINTNPALSPYLKAEYCTCKTSIQVLSDLNYLRIIETNNPQADFWLVSTNHYPFAIEEQHFDLLKYPPRFESTANYINDTNFNANYVSRNVFQFNVRYWYDDGEKSKWSPISLEALNLDVVGNVIEAFNAIKIDFTDVRLNDPESLCIIRKVELAFRQSNNDSFKTIKVLDVCEIGINQQYYIFHNDQLYNVVESDDATIDGSTQALALFDFVPILSGCLESSSDAKGNARIFCGSNLENYDPLDCIEMEFTVDDDPADACLCTIKGEVKVFTWFPTDPLNTNWVLLENNATLPTPTRFDMKDMVLDGFVVYLLGTNYFAVSDNPPDSSGTGIFEIKNVPKGKYILRVASYKCRFDDTLGRIHNLSNSLDWQRTSSPVKEVAGSLSQPGSYRFERFIDLTGFGGGVFDLSTQPGYGSIDIISLDNAIPNIFGVGIVAIGTTEYYFLDNNAQNDATPATDYAIRQAAINVELQFISTNIPTFGFINIIHQYLDNTDPNGYAFALYYNLSGLLFSSYTNQIKCAAPAASFRFFTPVTYIGGYYGLYGNNLPTPSGTFNQNNEFILINTDKPFTEENKSTIQGQVLDSVGNPVANALVVFQSTSRYVQTNQYGYYGIVFYCPYNDNFRIPGTSRLITTYTADTCYTYPIANSNVLTNAGFFFIDIDFDTPFIGPNPTFTNGFKMGILNSGRFLKRGGIYRVGLVYEDRGNRKNTVTEAKNKLKIPFHTVIGAYVKPQVSWSIDHVPPDWATHYRIVRTKETTYARYLHCPAIDVRYVKVVDSIDTPVDTTFAAGDATHILLGIGSNLESSQPTDPILWFYKQTADFGFQAQLKDRVRLILNQSGAIVVTGIIWEFEIVGQYLENDTYYVVIENTKLLQEIETGWLLELFTPKQSEEVIFYEVGESYEILFPFTDQRAHSGPNQDQIVIAGVSTQPATGKIKGGDTYWRLEDFAVSADFVTNYVLEHANISWLFPSINSDIGRANIADKNFFQQFYANRIRFSGLYLPGTIINGLSSFRAIDVQGIDQRYGILKKLLVVREVMLAICQFKIQPIYVGKDNLLDLSGRSNIGRSDDVLNLAVQLKEDFGTHNPESVIEDEGTAYGFDIYKGIAWRYSTNGLFPISDYKAINYFNAKGNQLLPLSRQLTRAFGGFDRFYKSYLISFAPIGEIPGETIGFDEPKNAWCSFFSFVPEMYGKFGKKLVSFKDGQLWVHDVNDVPYNNFYGVQSTSIVKFVSNHAPRAEKLWYNIDIQATKLWFCLSIDIPPTEPYQQGMHSELLPNKFVNRESIWMSDFLRDMNDTQARFLSIPNVVLRRVTALLQGRPLRGEVLIVTLQLDKPTELALLKRADIEFVLSMDTKG
jgi:hypothetical protein